jgi:hypothetical protein
MYNEMWLPTVVVVGVIDAAIAVVALAIVTDRQLLGEKSRWRFSLSAMLIAMAFVAVNTAIIAHLFIRR